jgi:hypothetical protein
LSLVELVVFIKGIGLHEAHIASEMAHHDLSLPSMEVLVVFATKLHGEFILDLATKVWANFR